MTLHSDRRQITIGGRAYKCTARLDTRGRELAITLQNEIGNVVARGFLKQTSAGTKLHGTDPLLAPAADALGYSGAYERYDSHA